MVSFRKMSMAFAGCLLMGVSAANASIPCTVSVDAKNLRAEALTQPLGDITVSCAIEANWATPDPAAATATIQVISDGFVFTNANDGDDNLSGVTLTVDGPDSGKKAVLSSDGKSVSFSDVDLAAFVAGSVPADTRNLVISGLKINSSALAALTSPKVRVNVITFAAPIAKLVLSDATQEIGTVLDAVAFGFKNKVTVDCAGVGALDAEDWDTAGERKLLPFITFEAGYPGALEVGDELTARFNVPAGARLFVASSGIDVDGNWTTVAVGADPLEPVVSFGAVAGAKFVEVKAVGGVYEATWTIEETTAKPTFRIPLYLVVPANSAAANNLTALGSLGPWSSVATSTDDAEVPEPRFVEPTSATDPIYVVSSCKTMLLFPYATNVGNWDTGIAIANQTADMKGADGKWASGKSSAKTGQAGACTLYFVGDNAPEQAIKTESVAAGQTLTFLVGSKAEGFNGYLKVLCDFSFGKGFAFLSSSDLGGVGVGYTAEAIGSLVP